jgi:hypothetical protein
MRADAAKQAAELAAACEKPAPAPARKPIKATPWVYVDPSKIPPREWLYGYHLIRKFVSATVANGGAGKSSLKLVEAVAMATGCLLLGVKPVQRCRVWVINLEDPREEMDRRIGAIMLHFGIQPEELEGWLFVDSGRDTPVVIAEETREGFKINKPVVDEILATAIENQIDVIDVDPFVSCHEVSENDNMAIDRVTKLWGFIAEKCNVAIGLVHHLRKTNGAEATVEDSRGGSAIVGAVRDARVLNLMNAAEAKRCGVMEPWRYFRTGSGVTNGGKANLAPPSAAQWFRMVTVDIGNATPAEEFGGVDRPSDKVGVVTQWTWPEAPDNAMLERFVLRWRLDLLDTYPLGVEHDLKTLMISTGIAAPDLTGPARTFKRDVLKDEKASKGEVGGYVIEVIAGENGKGAKVKMTQGEIL